MKATLGVLLLGCASCALHAGECAPAGMMHVVTSNVSPGIADDSFAAQPIVMYRSGNRFARLEEALDAVSGIHNVYVTNAPDAWVANLVNHTGTHFIDPSTKPKVTLPVFAIQDMPEGFPAEFAALEYGCESAFFAERNASLVPYAAGARELTKHQTSSGAWRLTLVTDKGSNTPQALLLSRDDKVVFALRYELFEHVDKIDPALFAKPAGIEFKDQ